MLNNMSAQTSPQRSDDASRGYQPGSLWSYRGRIYICRSAAEGAAIWHMRDEADNVRSNDRYFPATFSGDMLDVTPTTTADLVAFWPFMIDRPVGGAAVHVRTAGSGALCSFALYSHDEATGMPARRLINFGWTSLDTVGSRLVNAAQPLDVAGLHWLGVYTKLNGIATAPTYVGMGKANGRYLHRPDGLDLSNLAAIRHLSSSALAYTNSPPLPAPSLTIGNVSAPMPMLRAA